MDLRDAQTIDHDTSDVMAITGLSMAGHAQVVIDQTEAGRVMQMLVRKYPDQVSLSGPMPGPEEVRIFRRGANRHLDARLLQGVWPH